MALFKSPDPESALSKSIAEERTLRGQLEARLVAARKTATDCQIAARNATRTLADDKTLSALEEKEIGAERRVSNLSSEIADCDTRLAELQTQLAVAADQRIRKATALEIEKIAEGFTSAADNTVKALAALVQRTERMITFMPDAQGLHQFASRVQGELPDNIRMLTGLLRSHTDAVLAGGASATLPAPAPKPVPLPAPATTVQVCTLREVAFLDTAGNVQTESRGVDINLAPAVAERAIKLNAACGMQDPRRRAIKTNSGSLKIGRPLFRNCEQLSDGMVDPDSEPFAEPVLRSVPPATIDPRFTPIDRGPKFELTVARNLDIITREDDKK